MKAVFGMALAVACLMATAQHLCAQTQPASSTPAANSGGGQNAQPANPPNPAANQSPLRSQTQSQQNPFPEDTNSVPVMPSRENPGTLPEAASEAVGRMPLPPDDIDPVHSPEEAGAAEQARETSSSSSLAGMGPMFSGPDDDTSAPQGKRNRKGQQIEPEHHESAAEDENVGNYYLENKNWKAGLSRFQSALVLDPDNPDVYWGLAECQHHLGDFANARANYLKVMEYDPDSRHAKDARKALKEPELANAKPPSPRQ